MTVGDPASPPPATDLPPSGSALECLAMPFSHPHRSRSLAVLLLGLPALLAADMPSPPVPHAEPPSAALKALATYPASIDLDGARAEQRVGVLGEHADGRRWDLSRQAKLRVASEAVARVDG